MYRALGHTPMRVAELVAVHPDEPAFLMRRVAGESRFAQIADADEQLVDRAAVHRPARRRSTASTRRRSTFPSSARPARSPRHVLDEIAEWDTQYASGRWRRTRDLARLVRGCAPTCPTTATGRVVLVQGDTGPGNFMFDARPARRRSPTGSSRTGATSTTTSRGCWCATPSSGSPTSTRGWPTTSRRAASPSTRPGSATSACSPSSAPPSARSPGCGPATRGARSRGS